MTRLRVTHGRVGEDLVLNLRFTANGVLFDPFAINSVKIYDTETGGNLIETLPAPTKVSTGVYQTTWSVPVGTSPKLYYDRWDWQAQSDMSNQVRVYSFRIDGSFAVSTHREKKAPLFVTSKEADFFNHISKELIQCIVGQKVIYYSVSDKHTKSHRLYKEAIKKTTYRPVEINALVLYDTPVQTNSKFTTDTVYRTEVYFHVHELEERKLIPREGDFIKFGSIMYEISNLTQPQIVYGQIKNKVMVKASCIVSRKSQFEVLDNIEGA